MRMTGELLACPSLVRRPSVREARRMPWLPPVECRLGDVGDSAMHEQSLVLHLPLRPLIPWLPGVGTALVTPVVYEATDQARFA